MVKRHYLLRKVNDKKKTWTSLFNKYTEYNEIKATYQMMWGSGKAVLGGKIIALNAYIT